MFSQIWTHKSTGISSALIPQLLQALDQSDAVVIGAGAGLSASAGLTYSGERFLRYFKDFQDRYGIRDMYTGGFYPYETQEGILGVVEPAHPSQPLPVRAQTGLYRIAGACQKSKLFYPHHKCGPPVPACRLQPGPAVSDPGRLRPLAVCYTVSRPNLCQRTFRTTDGCRANQHADSHCAGSPLPCLRRAHDDESALR